MESMESLDSEPASPSPRTTSARRRPPSARSSGIITLPKSIGSPPVLLEDFATPCDSPVSSPRPTTSSPVPFNLDSSLATPIKPIGLSPLSVPSFFRPTATSQPSNSPAFVTGKLNASSVSEKAGALPPSRRGSSYSLMKAKKSAPQQKSLTAFDKISALNRPSHYERYGTIELLINIGADGSGLLQLLKAEGYDCLVLGSEEATADLVSTFNSKDVYPDVILMDCDLPSSSTAIIRNLQSLQPLASIICIGSVDSSMNAVSCLQAGAVDYLWKPLDAATQEELLARIERHVARQHGSKVSIEAALLEARAIITRMEQVNAAAASNNQRPNTERLPSFGNSTLLAVAENSEYEEQAMEIAELTQENNKLKKQIERLKLASL